MLYKISKPLVIVFLILAVLLMIIGVYFVYLIICLPSQSAETKFISLIIVLFLFSFISLSIFLIAANIKEISNNFLGRKQAKNITPHRFKK
jgi:uncharacterized BrkB/YihY/UPF0761 family membrane protein